MTSTLARSLFLCSALVLACGGEKGGETEGTGSSGQATTGGTATGPTTGGATGTATGSSGASASTGAGGSDYCPGVPPWDGYQTCATDRDCDDPFEYCTPTPGPGCGPPCGPECRSDDECAMQIPGQVCQAYPQVCCPNAASCVDACTPDSCPPEYVCAGDGHCVPQPCDGGWSCAEGFGCKVQGQSGEDLHGCVRLSCDTPGALPCKQTETCEAGACTTIACQVDANCPCGSCKQGTCYDRPWVCEQQAA